MHHLQRLLPAITILITLPHATSTLSYYAVDCYNSALQSFSSQINLHNTSFNPEDSHLNDLVAVLNQWETIEWHDNSWTVTVSADPFTVTLEIWHDAPQAAAGDIVGVTTSPDFAGGKDCVKLGGEVTHEDGDETLWDANDSMRA
ncbi:hypothetical protein ACMFMG_000486 [Clarireedia jacksonii]